MCGLTAIISSDSVAPPSRSLREAALRDSLEAIHHRGPDSNGTYVSPDGRVGLGHARLSIIDLENGQQPLSDEDDKIHCVVVGELYDYDCLRAQLEAEGSAFKTRSDSELVVQLYKQYGVNLFPYLRGEFAFVLYDSQRHLVLSARDRFGIKPLYYTMWKGELIIASEMKAFLALGWQAEWDIESIIQNGDFNDERTVFKGVKKVPPGNYLTFRRSSTTPTFQSYWDLTYDSPSVYTQSVDDMIATVRQHLVESVRVRLRSDVPLGVYLSGGIDSAAIAGIATSILRESNPDAKLSTLTLAFPDCKEHDEGPIARRMAESIGADILSVEPSEADLVEAFEKCVWHSEQPVSSFHGPGKLLLSKFARDRGFTVMLSGEGSDEIFGGYSFLLLDYLRQGDPMGETLGFAVPSKDERSDLIRRLESMPPPQDHISLSPMSFADVPKARAMLGGISIHRALATLVPLPEFFTPDIIETFGEPNGCMALAEGIDAKARSCAISGKWHSLHTSLCVCSRTLLPNYLLNQLGERSEMANSIEGRPPFLDHKLVQYVNGLPPSIKWMCTQGSPPVGSNGGRNSWSFTDKWILRQAVKPFVTEELYERKKVPYNSPLPRRSSTKDSESKPSPLQSLLRDRLTQASVGRLGWISWEHVEKTLSAYLKNAEFPLNGGLDQRARILLWVLSFVVLQERFSVSPI